MKTVKISPEIHKRLKVIAAEQERELGAVIEIALLEWINKTLKNLANKEQTNDQQKS